MVDPRVLYNEMDSELTALWLAHFALKNSPAPEPEAQQIDKTSVDYQVSAVERMLL